MSSTRERRPVVGIVSDARVIGLHRHYAVGEKYVTAVALGAGVTPVILPPLATLEDAPGTAPLYDMAAMLDLVDGIFLPGSESNLEPWRYGEQPHAEDTSWRDPQRDETSLHLIASALERGLPLFCVCRGFQELNVALGGSLHQQVHRVAGLMDHRTDHTLPREKQYAPAHEVAFAPDGLLRRIAGVASAGVNSLHEQGIARLAPRLVVEATAPDGLIEAARVADARALAVGVQWHPEWRFRDDPVSRALFAAFGEAVRGHAARGGDRVSGSAVSAR